jgi:predicted outer membrane repeat protein
MKIQSRALTILVSLLIPTTVLVGLLATVPSARAATTWTVGVDSQCPTIQGCVDHADILNGDIIFIPTGVYTERVTVNKVLTIRGAGQISTRVTADDSGRVFNVTALQATFEDLTIKGGRMINNFDQGAGIRASGSLTLTQVTVRDNTLTGESGEGAGVYVGGNLYVRDSLFQGNQCDFIWCSGGGLQTSGSGEVQIVNTDFISNLARWQGGGINNPLGPVTVIGGRFQGNQAIATNAAEPVGGGINAETLVMSGTMVVDNEAVRQAGSFGKGGGVYASSLTLTNTTFSNNYALHMGGAVFGAGQVTGGLFQGNNASLASAIGWLSTSPWTISNTTLTENSSTGIYVVDDIVFVNSLLDSNQDRVLYLANASAHLTMTGTTVQNTSGRGIVLLGSGTISASHFISNVAGISSQGTLDIASSSFLSNSGGFGAGVNGTTVRVRDSLFAYNRCQSFCIGGAGIYASAAAAVTHTQFLSNTADGAGAGLYVAGTAVIRDSLFQGNQSSNSAGAGVYVSGGGLSIADSDFLGNIAPFGAGASTNGPLTVTGSLFQENSGGGLSGGTTLISSSQFLSNTGVNSPAGVSAFELRITDSQFQNNTCSAPTCGGAAISVGGDSVVISSTVRGSRSGSSGAGISASGALTITGSVIEDNQCSSSNCAGGGVFSLGNVEINNSHIISNAGGGGGGGIFANGGLRLINSTLADNHCGGSICFGGGAQANSNQLGITVIDSQVVSNSAYVSGGGLHANGPISATGSLFENNVCTSQSSCYGGGVRGFDVTLSESIFRDNTAQKGGGAAHGDGITVTGSLFEGNRCLETQCYGGALRSGQSMQVAQSRFISNSAQYRGGALGVQVSGSDASLENLLMAGNTAGDAGQAIYYLSGSAASIVHVTIGGRGLISGSAIAVQGANMSITNTIIASHTAGVHNVSFFAVSEDYNLFFGNTVNLTGTVTSGGNSLTADPDFRDPANSDYRLGARSSGIDNALELSLSVDLDGLPRQIGPGPDRGAFETIYADAAILASINPPEPLLPGQPVTIALEYANVGPTPALASAVSVGISLSLADLVIGSSHAITSTGGFSWDVGAIPAGGSRAITLSGRIPATLTADTSLGVSASIGTASVDIDGNNDGSATSAAVVVPTVELASSGISAAEGSGTVLVTVTLNMANPHNDTLVHYATQDGTAAAGVDYVPSSGTLTIAAGETSAVLPITLLNNHLKQPDRTFTLALTNPLGGALGAPGAATITILDDDYAIYLPIVVKSG